MLADLTKLPPVFLVNALHGTDLKLKRVLPGDPVLLPLINKRMALAAEVARRKLRPIA